MRAVYYILLLAVSMAACQHKQPSEPDKVNFAATLSDTEVVEQESEVAPPRAADGLFDDFVYSFMRNRQFQKERITFPLSNIVDGKDKPVTSEAWKFDPLYANQEVYTVIFDGEKSMSAEKDTSLNHVIVEWINLKTKRIKQYHFHKTDGIWLLVRLDTHGMNQNENNDFYEFYNSFSSSESFQKSHIRNPFFFKTYDYDNFQTLEGVLDVTQWPDYRPALPQGVLTNINYGQDYKDSRKRVLLLCSPSGGMGCTLTFVKKGKTWMLERLEN